MNDKLPCPCCGNKDVLSTGSDIDEQIRLMTCAAFGVVESEQLSPEWVHYNYNLADAVKKIKRLFIRDKQ